MAKRVLLLTWLQVDPNAHTIRPLLTELQDWKWDGLRMMWALSDEPFKKAKFEDGKLIDPRDFVQTRADAREKFLDRERERAIPHLEAALKVVEAELPKPPADAAAQPTGDDAMPAPAAEWSAPMSKAELARRITGEDARARKIKGILNKLEIEQSPGCTKLWRVRLDLADPATRRKIEQRQQPFSGVKR